MAVYIQIAQIFGTEITVIEDGEIEEGRKVIVNQYHSRSILSLSISPNTSFQIYLSLRMVNKSIRVSNRLVLVLGNLPSIGDIEDPVEKVVSQKEHSGK